MVGMDNDLQNGKSIATAPHTEELLWWQRNIGFTSVNAVTLKVTIAQATS
jgi:hypothetical protein